jgi:hypothetical protein
MNLLIRCTLPLALASILYTTVTLKRSTEDPQPSVNRPAAAWASPSTARSSSTLVLSASDVISRGPAVPEAAGTATDLRFPLPRGNLALEGILPKKYGHDIAP